MRIIVDHGRDRLRLALSEADVAQTRTLAEGIAADYDAQGRLVALVLDDVARSSGTPDTLAALTIGLTGGMAGPEAAPPPTPAAAPTAPTVSRPPPVAERAALGPLTWEPEAEAAMARVQFFERGARRRAVVELARARGLGSVTAAMVEDTGRRR